MSCTNKYLVNKGSSQEKRLLPALHDEYFLVDEMSFETLLLLGQDIAAQLQFFDLENKKTGTWSTLFSNNEVVIMALILGENCDVKQEQFSYLQSTGIEEALNYLLKLYGDINNWYRQLKITDNPAAYELQMKIASVIDKSLKMPLFELCQLVALLNQEQQRPHLLDDFDPIWTSFSNEPTTVSIEANDVKHQLQIAFSALISSIQYLQTDTHKYLEQALKYPVHEPAIALFMTFLKLFKKAQNKLNTFTDRHADFYYHDILNFKSLPAVYDLTYLNLALEKGVSEPQYVALGHKFSAGKDENFNEIVYQATEDLHVHDAKVEQINTLLLQREPFISPERELNYITRITPNTLVMSEMGSKPVEGIPILGGDKSTNDPGVMPLGIVISAETLHLKEGLRKISISFNLGESPKISNGIFAELSKRSGSQDIQVTVLTGIFDKLLQADTELSANKNITIEAAFLVGKLSNKQFQNIFTCQESLRKNEVYKTFLLALLKVADNELNTYKILGKLFSRHTLSRTQWLNEADIEQIEEKCKEYIMAKKQEEQKKEGPLDRVLRLLKQDRTRTFLELYQDIFVIQISTEQGWKTIADYQIVTIKNNTEEYSHKDTVYGFTCELLLKQDFPEVIPCTTELHGEHWQLTAPAIQFSIKPQSTFFPYSIFSELSLVSLDIEVDVKGVTELIAYNQQGRLDPSKSFSPFGPQAVKQSHLIFSSEEIAHKNILDCSLNIDWSELPTDFDGFAGYYRHYDEKYTNNSFQVSVSILSGGQWITSEKLETHSLFQSQGNNQIAPTTHMKINTQNVFTPAQRKIKNTGFDYNLKSRNGFFKLTLVEPVSGFGHQQYASLLTRTLTENSKSKQAKAMPNLPYTPIINRFSVDYRAKTHIDLTDESRVTQGISDNIIHLHPFGFENIYGAVKSAKSLKNKKSDTSYLFPRYTYEGNLFIGLSGTEVAGKLNLFVHLDEKATVLLDNESEGFECFYLSDNRWIKLSDRQVVADTTNGFLTSGIITLDLPATINKGNTLLNSTLFWLRVSSNKQVTHYGNCFGIKAHGIKVARDISNTNQGKPNEKGIFNPIDISSHWGLVDNLPGLGEIEQLTSTFGGRQPETPTQLKQRISERLRHKDRAISARDYEQLILQQFPEIDQVTCLANIIFGKAGEYPGNILILVRRKVSECQHQGCDNYKVSVDSRLNIKQYIQSKSSAFIHIDVRAPEYEQIQIRCAITFVSGQQKGQALIRLNQELSTQLCPWNALGLNQGIGWVLELKEIEHFISRLSYVNFVTDVSILHIVKTDINNQNTYQLNDTARQTTNATDKNNDTNLSVKSGYPWSILMPVNQHALDVTLSTQQIKANITGISELEVGNNFIIQDKSPRPENDKSKGITTDD